VVSDLHYGFSVQWSNEDGEFVARCDEFPSLSCLDQSPVAALADLMALVDDIVIGMKASGEPVPQRIVRDGRFPWGRPSVVSFLLRTSPNLHKALTCAVALVRPSSAHPVTVVQVDLHGA